jgi:hypothetical protein
VAPTKYVPHPDLWNLGVITYIANGKKKILSYMRKEMIR